MKIIVEGFTNPVYAAYVFINASLSSSLSDLDIKIDKRSFDQVAKSINLKSIDLEGFVINDLASLGVLCDKFGFQIVFNNRKIVARLTPKYRKNID